MRDCIAYGWSQSECQAEIDDSMVGGVYCDGNILITAEGKRCIPSDVVKRVQAARQAAPLVRPSPIPIVGASPEEVDGARVLLAIAALSGVAYALYRIVR